jgi:hypothetical protein
VTSTDDGNVEDPEDSTGGDGTGGDSTGGNSTGGNSSTPAPSPSGGGDDNGD